MKCPHCNKEINVSLVKEEKQDPHPAIKNKTDSLIDDAVFGGKGVAV